MIYNNGAWPKGKWKLAYNSKDYRYHITTEYDDFIAEVGPTLVAYWLVKIYNSIFFTE